MAALARWSTLTGLELLRLLREPPFRWFRAAILAVAFGAFALPWLRQFVPDLPPGLQELGLRFGGGVRLRPRPQAAATGFIEAVLGELPLGIAAALHLGLPMILSAAVLERGAESPTLLLRLTPLAGWELLLVKCLAGIGVFAYACLPALPLLGFACAFQSVPLGRLAWSLGCLLLCGIQVGILALAFGAASKAATTAYRRTMFALALLSFVPGAAAWQLFLIKPDSLGNWLRIAGIVALSMTLTGLAWRRAGMQLDDADDLVGMRVTPPEATRPLLALDWAERLAATMLGTVGLGALIPGLSYFAFELVWRLENPGMAAWLLFQAPATIGLAAALAERLAFSPCFDPSGSMHALLLAAPTSATWWFRRLLARRNPWLFAAAAGFAGAGVASLSAGWDVGLPVWLASAAEIAFGTLWLFVFVLASRPRILASAAFAGYLAAAYGLQWAAPTCDGRWIAEAGAIALVAAAVARRWPATPVLAVLAASLYHVRGYGPALAALAWPELAGQTLLSALTTTRGIGIAEHQKKYLGALLAGDVAILALAAWWLRANFDVLVGRTGPRPWFGGRRSKPAGFDGGAA